jgi:hypothetical protein
MIKMISAGFEFDENPLKTRNPFEKKESCFSGAAMKITSVKPRGTPTFLVLKISKNAKEELFLQKKNNLNRKSVDFSPESCLSCCEK